MNTFGLIETIKVINGRPVFKNLHIDRLHKSLQQLNIPISAFQLEDRILRLLKYECVYKGLKNVRLRIEIQKNRMHDYLPEINSLKWNVTFKPLAQTKYVLNETALNLTVYQKEKKIIDNFSNLKHSDRIIYNHAFDFAAQNGFNEALVLNTNNTLADASIYNVFVIKNEKIYTPSLSDAPVNGILRRLLVEKLQKYKIVEKSISINDIYNADEIFLTNAIRGIQIATQIEDKLLDNNITQHVFHEFKDIVFKHFGEDLL
jgi:branched-chain amino acid aminotransferase